MGYPYSWHKSSFAGILGPGPQSLNLTTNKEFDLHGQIDSELFFAGFSKLDLKSLIRASIQRILMTEPGERVMLPEFGCNIRKFCFEPNTKVLEIEIKNEILTALNRWEPRITVESINIVDIAEDSKINIIVPYKINGTDISDKINYIFSKKSIK